MSITKEEFLKEYTKCVQEDEAALFVGAGLSVPAGFVNWRTLLKGIAKDLGLDIDLESDLLAVAQYEFNRSRSRDKLNRAIMDEFTKNANITENHRLLARLPISVVWTTNYDKLLENSYDDAGKRCDVKHEVTQLPISLKGREVSIYKMHGDVDHPNDAILTKHDYECYERTHEAFISLLSTHLLSKTFLFTGLSFTDPNIEYTFNRVDRLLDPLLRAGGRSKRRHYCILRRPQKTDFKGPNASKIFIQEKARLKHRIEDLKRFGVQTLLIDAYSEITALLDDLIRRVRTVNVQISGAIEAASSRSEEQLKTLCEQLGRELIESGYNIISGFGKGIGAEILIGAHQALARPDGMRSMDRLRLCPFPYWCTKEAQKKTVYAQIRNEMAMQAGVTIFISGNKKKNGEIVISDGVMKEFEQAKNYNHLIIPVGYTGYAAKNIWQQLSINYEKCLSKYKFKKEWNILGDRNSTVDQTIKAILSILDKYKTKIMQ
jgi:hypothetical protein